MGYHSAHILRSLILGIGFPAVVLGTGTTGFAQMTVSEQTVPAFETALAAATAAAGIALPFSGIVIDAQPAGGEDPGTELINGTIVDATFFPAVLRASTGTGACTASLIGPSAALLAAHCFSSDIALVSFRISGRSFRGLCQAAPGFAERRSEDWALCVLERSVGGITYETVELTTVPATGTRIMLTGYGCTQEGEGAAVRPLRAGISRVSIGTGATGDRSYIFTKSDRDAGDAILCQGDSGGPAFVLHGNTVSDSRTIVGVNSRTQFSTGMGLISATGSQAGRTFIRDWAQRNDQAICGHNPPAGTRCM